MKHRTRSRKLNRTSAHHKAMQRNLAQSLFQHGQITTTVQKAKDLRPFVERLISLARNAREGSITARRRIHKLLSDRSFISPERQSEYEDLSLAKREKTLRARSGRRYRTGAPKGKLKFTGQTISHQLITSVAARFSERAGGFTRLIRLGRRRIGDGGELAVVQLVGDEQGPGALAKPERSARQVRADARYALAIKLAKQRRGGKPEGGKSRADESRAEGAATATAEAPESASGADGSDEQ
jgi:large subunit ribosomal protein L17